MMRPLRPCAMPGCPKLVSYGHCQTHKREYAKRRGTTTQQGYGSKWRRAREHFANVYPPVRCECCGIGANVTKLRLDHDHATGQRRGWLCNTCNQQMGEVDAGRKPATTNQHAYLALAHTRCITA